MTLDAGRTAAHHERPPNRTSTRRRLCRTCRRDITDRSYRSAMCVPCAEEARVRYLADAKRRQRSRENVEDRLNVAISYKLVARLARARLQRANRRWRNRHPDLAALLAAERERRA